MALSPICCIDMTRRPAVLINVLLVYRAYRKNVTVPRSDKCDSSKFRPCYRLLEILKRDGL